MLSKYLNYVLNILIRVFFSNFSHRLCAGSVSMYPGWDFSGAVSGFCQLFRDPLGQHAETRERPLVPRLVSIEAPIKAGAYRQDGGKTRTQSILIIITVIIMGNVVFFFIQNISKHFFLVDSGQNWPTMKKMRILDQNHGLHSPGLWKNSHFGDYIKLIFLLCNKSCFSFRKSTNI